MAEERRTARTRALEPRQRRVHNQRLRQRTSSRFAEEAVAQPVRGMVSAVVSSTARCSHRSDLSVVLAAKTVASITQQASLISLPSRLR